MKVLFLSQGRKIEDHPGWNYALQKLKEEGFIDDFLNVPWIGYGESHGWDAFYDYVVKTTGNGCFDVVYFHYYHNGNRPSPAKCIRALKRLNFAPVVITSAGDGFSDSWLTPDYPLSFKDASREADITFSTQMGKAADKMIRWGAKRIVYTPNSMCPVRFKASSIDPLTHNFDFDIVMVGSRNKARINPFSRNFWESRIRTKLVVALSNKFGKRFGLFGRGWDFLPSAQGVADFNTQHTTFQRGRILVGGNPYSHSDYYSSNRVFFEISSGIPTVELYVNRLDKVLRNNDQIYFADSIDGVIAKCEELLKKDPIELYVKAAKAAKEIELRHTQYHRMKFKLDTVKRYIANGHKLDVEFPFFLPEVDLSDESRFAIKEGGK